MERYVEEISNQMSRLYDLLYYRFLDPLRNIHDDLCSIRDTLKELADAVKALKG